MSEGEVLYGSDLVLLLLDAPTSVVSASGQINGITRLEKLLYLAMRETEVFSHVGADRLEYVAYNYGPFSKDVYEAVDILEESSLLTESSSANPDTIDGFEEIEVTGADEAAVYVERKFKITDNGHLVAGVLSKRHPNVVTALSDIKNKYAERSLSELIRYVYQTYPESAEKSKIRSRYL